MSRKSTTEAVFFCEAADGEVQRGQQRAALRFRTVAEKYVTVEQDTYNSCRTVVRCAVDLEEEFYT